MSSDIPEYKSEDESELDELEEREPWERQHGESVINFELFKKYRDMGIERSTKKVAVLMNRSHYSIKDVCTANNWVNRVAAWHDYLDEEDRKQQLAERKKMNKRQAEQAASMQTCLMLPVHAMMKRMQENPASVQTLEGLSTKDLVKVITSSASAYPGIAKLERIARGESTDKITQEHTGAMLVKRVEVEIVKSSLKNVEQITNAIVHESDHSEWDAQDTSDGSVREERE